MKKLNTLMIGQNFNTHAVKAHQSILAPPNDQIQGLNFIFRKI